MALVCAQCSHVNPPEAAYCYHDGASLAGRAGGPINPGSASFPTPFVFPNGAACRNFDQLAMTCQQSWAAALDLLKQGYLASFFGGLGRVDLALAAQDAAKFPDPDRGLDQLLAKLPSQVLEAPKLQAEPGEISLGQLPVGSDRTIELHLRNRGMRLLYGSVASDCKWLTVGEVPGQPQKVFQFGDETVVHVQVRGQYLRAGTRPLEGQLIADSNGGTVTITVRADVPVTPFPDGPFAGAVTPRQVAEKAKVSPKDTAPYFEDGRVAAWFQSNGWTYPVQGPPMSGMGAVQQFFEALGVAKPPLVQVSPATIRLDGAPHTVHQLSLEVSSPERKVVYGWATADQPWVAVGKTMLTGRSAVIPVTVTVPDRAGTQTANLAVVGNGQQRFTVPVSVAVIGGADVVDAEILDEPEILGADMILDEPPVMTPAPPRPPSVPILSLDPVPRPAAMQPIAAPPPFPPPLVASGEATVAFTDGPAPAGAGLAEIDAALAVGTPGALVSRPAALLGPPRAGGSRRWLHAVPAVLLVLALGATLVRDIGFRAYQRFFPSTPSDVDTRELLRLGFDYNFDTKRVNKNLGNSMMAGLVRVDPGSKGGPTKRLTFGTHGHTNSVVVRIDGKDRVFGDIQKGGRYRKRPEAAGPAYAHGKICEFEFFPEGIVVTQEVRIVPGESVEVTPGEYKHMLDTCLFRYYVKNDGSQAHEVGLRYLLDTYIGNNDGVPFTLPGQPGLVDTFTELKGDDVPDFIQVLEHPDLKEPGLIAQLGLRLSEKYEVPKRVELTAHPMSQRKDGLTKDSWDIPLASIKEYKDSCVVLYWDSAQLTPGQHRDMAFTYGLGSVSIGPSAKLGLTVGGAMLVNSDLTVVALVADPQPNQTVELTLPPGLTLAGNSKATQDVLPSAELNKEGKPRPTPITWRVRATAEGSFPIVVTTRSGAEPPITQERRIFVKRAKLF